MTPKKPLCDNNGLARSLRHVAKIDQTPFPADILDLSHDGRGVARRDNGKAVFVAGALPGEKVMAKQTARSRSFDEATTLEVLQRSPDRVEPRCPHFGTCGGCALQHLDETKQILAKQRAADATTAEGALESKAQRRLERLQAEAAKLREWLKEHPHDRKSAKGKPRLSNRTDNESAKMPTDKGVIQGYTGVAAVDEAHQIILEAQAHGTGSEQELLLPVSGAIQPIAREHTVVCADSGYHSEDNLKRLEDKGLEAFIPDRLYRQRDPRYAGQEQHTAKPEALWDKSDKPAEKPKLFQPSDFKVAADQSHCICPAGKRLYRNGGNCNIGGRRAIKFSGAQRDCGRCQKRAQCLRHPQRTPVRQVAIFLGKHAKAAEKATERMKRKIDTERGREMLARRFATVEPVFGNLRCNKGLNRFTLRGRQKVDGQWKLYCLVHNIEKLAHSGYAK